MKFNIPVIVIFTAFVLLLGCKEKHDIEILDVNRGYEYFPLEIGKFIEYSLDSIVFDTLATGVSIETKSWLAKEMVIDTFRDLSNHLNFQIERLERRTESDPWEVKAIFTAFQSNEQAIKTEDNFRFIKMVYPLEDGDIWDGNLFIDEGTVVTVAGESIEVFKSWSYEVESIDEIDVINSMAFDSVMVISQANNQEGPDPNLIELRYSREKYAKGVGLIYKEMRILDTQCISDCVGQTWEEKAQKGFILIQSIIDHN